ncbi:hypothetical protein GOODEAATRI_005802 [Goodea atripinnis]|uniref:DEP domain-containing protein n=1 Tax=Goodea atripinnis TaxID=208336 RepID=A0ABV0PBQ2_9TELE
MALGWGVPFVMVGVLLLSGERTETIDSAFFYGRAQIISSTVVLAVSLALGAISLMGLNQGNREQIGYEALSRAAVTGINDERRAPGDFHNISSLQTIPDMIASTQREHTNSTDHSGASCDGQQPSLSASEQPLDLPPPGLQSTDDKQTVRHVLLCVLLSVSLLADEQQGYVSIPDGHNEEVSQHELGTSPPQSCPESVFRGSNLVDWLMERGLCVGRTEAKLYCVCLQQGGVLTGQQSFRDEPTSFYHFTQEERCSRNM